MFLCTDVQKTIIEYRFCLICKIDALKSFNIHLIDLCKLVFALYV